jgi:dehydrogenase/reductase SDR family protein 12
MPSSNERKKLIFAAGWADTPGVATAMPGFRAKFEASLRSSEQGADTVIWLATRPDDCVLENGAFYFDRCVAKKHLPLAGTQVRAPTRLRV